MNGQASGSPDHVAPPSRAAGTDDTRELIRQVHQAVTSGRRSGRMQVLTAVVLSLATLTTTWCGYQASRWSGAQSAMQAEADTLERQAAENTLAGLQIRTQDGLVTLELWRALREGDEPTRATVFAHMRPELQRAIEASIADGILQNPAAQGPLQRAEYALEVESQARAQRAEAARAGAQAGVAGRRSSQYVLITLMLSSVLFVGGVSNTFSRLAIRRVLGVVALAVFGVAAVLLARLPVQWPQIGGAPSAASTE